MSLFCCGWLLSSGFFGCGFGCGFSGSFGRGLLSGGFFSGYELDAGGFGHGVEPSLAASGGIFLEEILFDGFVVFGLSFGESLGRRVGFEGLESGLDVFLDSFVVLGTFNGLPGSLFGRFDNRHFLPI